MGRFIDLTNKTFGRLKVKEFVGKKGIFFHWKCDCECGNTKIANGALLRNGRTKSCGCLFSPPEKEYLKKLEVRLLKYSELNQKNGCREWNVLNRTTSFGYGFINFRRKQIMAHRAAWKVWKGEIPKGKFVLHQCDNPLCINPDHLFLGTHQDNMNDMKIKFRQNNIMKASKGEKNHFCKLTEDIIHDIRISYDAKLYSVKELAIKYNVSDVLIYKIINRKVWKHLIDSHVVGWLDFSIEDLKDVIENKGFWNDFAKSTAKKALDIKLGELL